MSKILISELKSYKLSELRTLGREVGVKAPSTLKKDDLIEKIIDILDGVTPPHNTIRGRPKLNSDIMTNNAINKIIEQYKNSDKITKKKTKSTHKQLVLRIEKVTNELKELLLELI